MSGVFVLAIGMFALGIDAYVAAGLLTGIARSFSVTEAQAGQCVAVFTLSYAISAPLLSALVGGKSVRTVLTAALLIFGAANAASVLAGSFPLLLAARALAGFGAGLFSPLAAATASALVPANRKGWALGMVLGGMSTGTVVGVPVGLWINDGIGWRGTLGLVTLIGLIALVGVAASLPRLELRRPPSLSERLAVLTRGKVAATVGITFATAVGSLGLYTYLASELHALAGVTTPKAYLWAWGFGGLVGSFSIGPLIDRTKRPAALLGVILVALCLALASLPTLVPLGAVGFLPFLVWGAMGWSSLAPQQHMLLALEPEHGPAAVALNSSCNYLGGAIGTFAGGALMASGASPAFLPYWAAATALAALAGHVAKLRLCR